MKPLTNTVVHLPTQEEYDEYMKMCEEAGWKWKNTKLKATYHLYKSVIGGNKEYVKCCDGMTYSQSKSDFEGYKIITLKQLKDMNKTLETLEVGDAVVDNNGDKREVIAIVNRLGDKTTYLLENTHRNTLFYSAFELGRDNYKPLSTETPELTMEEAIKKMGFNFKIKK